MAAAICLLGLFTVLKQPWAWICHPVFEPGPLVDRCSDAKLGTWPGLAKKGASEIRPAQIPNDKSRFQHCPYQKPTNPFSVLYAAVVRYLISSLLPSIANPFCGTTLATNPPTRRRPSTTDHHARGHHPRGDIHVRRRPPHRVPVGNLQHPGLHHHPRVCQAIARQL